MASATRLFETHAAHHRIHAPAGRLLEVATGTLEGLILLAKVFVRVGRVVKRKPSLLAIWVTIKLGVARIKTCKTLLVASLTTSIAHGGDSMPWAVMFAVATGAMGWLGSEVCRPGGCLFGRQLGSRAAGQQALKLALRQIMRAAQAGLWHMRLVTVHAQVVLGNRIGAG